MSQLPTPTTASFHRYDLLTRVSQATLGAAGAAFAANGAESDANRYEILARLPAR